MLELRNLSFRTRVATAIAFSLGAALLAACSSGGGIRANRGSVTVIRSTTEASSISSVPTGTSPVVYGIDVNQFDQDIGAGRVHQVLDMIRQAGGTAVRIGGAWAAAEPAPGHYDWSAIDALFAWANADGLTVLFELGTEPSWDASGGNVNAPPADCASTTASCTSVTQYVTSLVTHGYPEGLRYLIVRNEPQNFNKNWVGGTADTYARFQQVVYQAAHRSEPGIDVLNGGTEDLSPNLTALRNRIEPPTPYEEQSAAFATSLYENPTWCDSLDVLDIHAGDHGPVYSPQIVDSSESALESCNGGRHVPVWVTEVGYPSIPSLQASNVYQVELDGSYQGGESGQARFLSDTFAALAKDPNVVGVDWTFMIDPNTSDTVPPGSTYIETFSLGIGAGLANSTYQTKSAYLAYQATTGARQ